MFDDKIYTRKNGYDGLALQFLIFILIRTSFLSSVFSLVKATFLTVCLNIVRLLALHSKFKKRKALKKR